MKTKMLGFVDDFAFAVWENDLGFADFLLMSRSRLGYWDLGTNRRRVCALADELCALYL